jgi:hypothetical protein
MRCFLVVSRYTLAGLNTLSIAHLIFKWYRHTWWTAAAHAQDISVLVIEIITATCRVEGVFGVLYQNMVVLGTKTVFGRGASHVRGHEIWTGEYEP